jgi:transposase InsO family protein
MTTDPLKTLALHSTINIRGDRWTLIGFCGGSSALLHREGTPMDDDNLLTLALPVLFELVGPVRLPDNLHLREADDLWPDNGREMVSHLAEVDHGTPKNSQTAPRVDYDPKTTLLRDRVQTKVAELSGTPLQVSERTLHRYLKCYREGGAAALNHRMVTAKLDRGGATSNLSPELEGVIYEVIREQVNAPTRRIQTLIDEIKRRMRRDYPDRPLEVSDRQLRRYIEDRSAGQYLGGLATTRRTAANTPAREFADGIVTRPGARVEIDSTPFDVLVRGDEGSFRPHLTMMWDVATATPRAWMFHPKAAKGVDHALLLQQAVTGAASAPGHEATRTAAGATLPLSVMQEYSDYLNDPTQAIPFIYPEEITVDGGADFRSQVFEDASKRYGITLNLTAPGSPTQKPHVERIFRTIREGFAEKLPGYVGQSVAHRGRLDDPVLSLSELKVLFELWVATVYMNTPTDALRDPVRPRVRWTPRQRYASLLRVTGEVPVPFSREDALSILPVVERTLQSSGVNFQNRVYTSPQLREFYRLDEGTIRRKFRILYNPHNLDCVWIEHPTTGARVELLDRNINWTNAPFAQETSDLIATAAPGPESEIETHRNNFIDTVTQTTKTARRRPSGTTASTASLVPAPTYPTRPAINEPERRPTKRLPRSGGGLIDIKEAL